MQPGLSRAGTGSSSAPPYRKSPRSCIAKHPQETSAAEYGTHCLWFYEDINLLMHSFNTFVQGYVLNFGRPKVSNIHPYPQEGQSLEEETSH